MVTFMLPVAPMVRLTARLTPECMHSQPLFDAARFALSLSLLPLCACATPRGAAPSAPEIHTVTSSPSGISVNAYLIEAERGVIAVDSALINSDARQLRERLAALGKPLLAVLLTHGHPDHYNGVTELIAGHGDVP